MLPADSHNPYELPGDLPVPADDGAARHLLGTRLPHRQLPSTGGDAVWLDALPRLSVLFFYPRTGVPREPPNLGFSGEAWESIPGARGCTPQCLGFRDVFQTLSALGLRVFGVSTQTSQFQREFKERNHVPFEFLSDSELFLTNAMNLPTFQFPVESGGPNTLIKRMAWLVYDNRIIHIWYPVFPSSECAQRVIDWVSPRKAILSGLVKNHIRYQLELRLNPDELASVFTRSGIRRPSNDADRLSGMLGFANCILSARDASNQLVGVLRGFTDFAWRTYVSDVAVAQSHQRQGIGSQLLRLAQTYSGPRCSLSLDAAPSATAYYPHIGMAPAPSAWVWPRTE